MLREILAAQCHRQWSGWMRYLFQFGIQNGDGTFTIGANQVIRWRRQMATAYRNLSPEEQESDRKEADEFIELLLIAAVMQGAPEILEG